MTIVADIIGARLGDPAQLTLLRANFTLRSLASFSDRLTINTGTPLR